MLPSPRIEGRTPHIEHDPYPNFVDASLKPSLESAVDDALNKGDGDLLTDAVVKIRNLFAVLGTVATLSVEADVVDTRQRP